VVPDAAEAPAAAPIAPEADTGAPPAGGLTEYRLVAGSSNKFWRVGVEGNTLIVEFGRIGTKGQRVVKSFDDEARARREATKLTLEKTGKGYEEFG
jgi:predicted DNA-binding WGR domain protein